MTFFLGIDGGGTGCRAAVADSSGRILGRGSSGPANVTSDLPTAGQNILAAARAALAEAVGPDAVEAELPRLVAGLGLAGANTISAGAFASLRLPFARIRVETDAISALRGALWGGDGIVAAVGTGSVFARQRNGEVRQIGGWGLVLGDEGSGAAIGRAILARALRAVDGFVPLTPLLQALIADHGDPAGIVTFAKSARPADFAALAPRVVESSDHAACAVMDCAIADVAAAVDLLQEGMRLPVVFIGGLGPVYARALADRWEIREPLGSSLDGALLLAREEA